MSRIHHVRKSVDKTETSCGLKLRNMRVTKIPMEATCGDCRLVLIKQYRDETDPYRGLEAQSGPAIASAQAWWNGST